MRKSRKNFFNITLVLSVIFTIVCIIAVWYIRFGDRKESPQTYFELKNKATEHESVKPLVEKEKTSNIIIEQEESKEGIISQNKESSLNSTKSNITQEEIKVEDHTEVIDTELENTIKSFFEKLNSYVREDWSIDIPSVYSINWIRYKLNNKLSEIGYRISDSTIYNKNNKMILEFKFNKKTSKGKVAIIIDDVGRSTRLNTVLQEIELPLNISILPKQRKSTEMSIIGKKEGWNVLLHLPMEPKEKSWIDGTFIKVGMNDKEIEEKIDSYLKELPYVQGINNHMGSLATTDENVMRTVLNIVKGKGLYFIDSLTISNSVGEKIAKEIGLDRFAKRDIFLDNVDEKEYIKSQIDALVELAINRGFAIGIGHLRENTLMAIKDYDWNSKEVELVLLSDIL